MEADDVLAEALARVEYKLDQLLTALKIGSPLPMAAPMQSCPACSHPIEYLLDVNRNVVVRKCKCGTGKLPAIIPLTQLPQIKTYGTAPTDNSAVGSEDNQPSSKDRRKRQGS